MNLIDLKDALTEVNTSVIEDGRRLQDIEVSMQIAMEDGRSVWTRGDLELNYDNDGLVSGCVITGVSYDDPA